MIKKSKGNIQIPSHSLTEWYYTKVTYPIKENIGKDSYWAVLNGEIRPTYVYVIFNRISKLSKIGITNNPDERFRNLQNQSGIGLDILLLLELNPNYDEPASLIEDLLHTFFNLKRGYGEWFNLNIKDVIAIRNLFYKIEGEDLMDNIKEVIKSEIAIV